MRNRIFRYVNYEFQQVATIECIFFLMIFAPPKRGTKVMHIYRVFWLNLTVDVFFVKSNIYRRKKQIFSKIKRC